VSATAVRVGWEIAVTSVTGGDYGELAGLLADGWEPYAVALTGNGAVTVHYLKRHASASAVEHTDSAPEATP
jgi:hypothetical protein